MPVKKVLDTETMYELHKYAPLPLDRGVYYPGGFELKLKSARGVTGWIDITPEQARAIERVLYTDETTLHVRGA